MATSLDVCINSGRRAYRMENHMTKIVLLIATHLAAALVGAFIYRNNPIAGAKTLAELDAAYAAAKAKLK